KNKRDGRGLGREEIAFLVKGYTRGEIPDYQMAAFLMAVCWRGMTRQETIWLTEELVHSGSTIPTDSISGKKIDKHSTGGVGDKVSLVLAPLVASMGVRIPMVSGRALGHTGGTLDKLESIPRFRTQLYIEEIRENVRDIGLAIAGQTEELVPADKKLYALRDVTATVDSIPLISASIMAKKLAESVDGLVLDVKTGSGAFMRNFEDACTLAQNMVDVGNSMQKPTVAIITDMNQPLGRMVGNATEVFEVVEALQGRGPEDLITVTLELGIHMLRLAGICKDRKDAGLRLEKAIRDGRAMKKFQEMVERQGGDVEALENFDRYISNNVREVPSPMSGYVAEIDTYRMGLAAVALGAGRKRISDTIDHSTGYEVLAKLCDVIEKGKPLVKVFYNDKTSFEEAEGLIRNAYVISDKKPPASKLIHKILEG
ncbi:MAG: thymidine phosphorylase, partial [Candidatus Brocadiales bacterium]